MSHNPDGSQNQFYTVAIGASAGGIAALKLFFSNCKPSNKLAYVVLQHLSPDYESYMDELLSKETPLNVTMIKGDTEVQPSNVYLCPPGKYLLIKNGILRLQPRDKNHERPLIDDFFESLAKDKKDRAFAIILSGSGSDGTRGIQAIRRYNGTVLVQDEETAEFSSMPLAAIGTGMVDYICNPQDMFNRIILHLENPDLIHDGSNVSQGSHNDQIVKEILELINDKITIDFSKYKIKSIRRRIDRRMNTLSLTYLREYLTYIQEHPEEKQEILDDFLIGVTEFFRDQEVFDQMRDFIIPRIFEMNSESKRIRIWIPGCSTGQEVYSLAILFHQFMVQLDMAYEIKIFGTDLDDSAVKFAGRGIYPESAITNLKDELLDNYFTNFNDSYQIKDKIRRMVIFSKHDILTDPPFLNLDLISCRNLLIYFKKDTQYRTISIFKFGLKKQGFLLLGTAETLGNSSKHFDVIDPTNKIFQFRGQSRKEILKQLQYDPNFSSSVQEKTHDAPKVQKNNLSQMINSVVVHEFAPPGVVIDKDFDVIQIYGDVNDFLKIPAGNTTNNLLDLLRDNLKIAVRTSVHKTIQLNQVSTYTNIPESQSASNVGLIVTKPIKIDQMNQAFILVLFQTREISPNISLDSEDIRQVFEQEYQQTISSLEYELQNKEETLQSTVEELETSNEELQSTNEELTSANEELKSTNEELQSVNEELNAVNLEFKEKIEELMLMNTDLDNLIMSTRIGYIFLDDQLKIRKFSNNITKAINLKHIDINRKITDLSTNFVGTEFVELVKKVYADVDEITTRMKTTGSDIEHDVVIRPYKLEQNKESGIIITISNLSL